MPDSKNSNSQSKSNVCIKIINERIEKLRLKLLDLTFRNPLISTKLKSSGLNIRIVDESLSFLFDNLQDYDKGMKIIPLPALEEKLKDEATREFRDAVSEAFENDEEYLRSIEEIEDPDLLAKVERSLKDRVREKLQMPPRQTKESLSLEQHARNHGINPEYNLPLKGREHQDGRHSDKNIQTLLLPDSLTRNLNKLHLKDRTWQMEAGINVLRIGFGFIEWKERENSVKKHCSPLILLPVKLESKLGPTGQEFFISSEEPPEWNVALSEKMVRDYKIELPKYEDNQPIEEYLHQIELTKPLNISLELKRWVVLGIFPSVKLSMYYDLGANQERNFCDNPIISSLLGGNDDSSNKISTVFNDEYDIDNPAIESKVPLIITDADSSQFSTIIDIMDGKNLVVEGPPGTGKSQTIVNTIAASLAQGKKVMFVAEKSAALEVVASRLESFGLGHFLLPLQANKSSKEKIISSIRDRIEFDVTDSPQNLETLKDSFKKKRDELAVYINILSSKFGNCEQDISQILGNAIGLKSDISNLAEGLKSYIIPSVCNISKTEKNEIENILKETQNAWLETERYNNWWHYVKKTNMSPLFTDEILDLAKNVSKEYQKAETKRLRLEEYGANSNLESSSVSKLEQTILLLPNDLKDSEIDIIEKLEDNFVIEKIKTFHEEVLDLESCENYLLGYITDIFNADIPMQIKEMADFLKRNNISSLNDLTLNKIISDKKFQLSNLENTISILTEVNKLLEDSNQIMAKHVINASKIINTTSDLTISLRSDKFCDPDARILIDRVVQQVNSLLKDRISLNKKVKLIPSPKREDVLKSMSALKDAHRLAFFFSKYRQSKRFFINIDLEKNSFSKKRAYETLQELEIWLSGKEELESNKRLQELLGCRFEGLETKFEPYFEVFEYFCKVDHSLSHLNCISLKNLLKSGNRDLLLSFPKISDDHPINRFPDVSLESGKELKCKYAKELDTLKDDVNNIRKIAHYLKDRDICSIDKLYELSDKVNLFQNRYEKTYKDNAMKELIGTLFNGAKTDIKILSRSINVASQIISSDQRSLIIKIVKRKHLGKFQELLKSILVLDAKALQSLKDLLEKVQAPSSKWYHGKTCGEIADYMNKASQDKSGLIAFSKLSGLLKDLGEKGYSKFIERIFKEYSSSCDIVKIFRAIFAKSMIKEVYELHGNTLNKFDGRKLSSLRKEFVELDVQIIELSKQYLQTKLHKEAKVPEGSRGISKSKYTNMALLRHEISKTRRYLPIREITKRAGEALIEIKPCWMMSPLAVATYIPKDTLEFDLVIIDEASQMMPENSIGALLRAKQVMVVGDINQLPPSNFFNKIINDEDEDKDDVVTETSILEMASSVFYPKRRLRWHYRSRNSSLIAFSNCYIYDNNLIVFPSANEKHPEMGVSYKKVEEGYYSAGVNPNEAKLMVDNIIDFMSKFPDKSLGVVVMNQKQANLITEEMNYAFERYPEARSYSEKWKKEIEYFFIKNLENVQGDERDVIFIGTVYGSEKAGSPVMQRFGPINGVNGRRRLNVLFSRAKERIVTFSSMCADDIKVEKGTETSGAHMLKKWLEYCSTGLIYSDESVNSNTDSEFEDHVIQQIKSIGCEAIPQVGVNGYFIDIGIKHPDWPNGFIMGVECDGAAYHSSKSARDRDRLRQQVLEGLGWYLYRIWSTDWFNNPIGETEKLRERIESRMKDLKSQHL